jgi:hypothetical protein
MVQITLGLAHCLISNLAVVESLWEVMSKKPVGVFVGTTLATVVRISKVDLHWQSICQLAMVKEFCSIIESKRLDHRSVDRFELFKTPCITRSLHLRATFLTSGTGHPVHCRN